MTDIFCNIELDYYRPMVNGSMGKILYYMMKTPWIIHNSLSMIIISNSNKLISKSTVRLKRQRLYKRSILIYYEQIGSYKHIEYK